MHADAHFVIGQAHVNGGKPCQDYATSGELPDGAYVVVSDGCSSGGMTDVGARILALGTAAALRQPWSQDVARSTRLTPGELGIQQQAVMAGAGAMLGTRGEDLLATCVYAVASPGDIFAFVQGDGVVAWRIADGTLFMSRFDWDENAPCYPAYARDDYRGFLEFHGGDSSAERLTSATWFRRPGGEFELHSEYRHSLASGMRGIYWPLDAFAGISQLAVFTDGVTQIDGTPWQQAVADLMNFKSTTGEFAKRRLNSFVRGSHKTGRGPIDDLAYAVIDLAPEEESC
jgi:hypothetical protein